MNQIEKIAQGLETNYRGPLLDKDHGYFASASVTLDPDTLYQFCRDAEHVRRVLKDFPGHLETHVDLALASNENQTSSGYKVLFETTPKSKISGTLIFNIMSAPANRGSIITCDANFGAFNWGEETPSSLINLFLKRMKSLMETGEIPTTKGQPSGREELTSEENKTLH